MSEGSYENQVIEINSPSKNVYIHNIEIPLFLGWKIIQQKENILEMQNTLRAQILYFKSLEESRKTVNFQKISAEIHVKNNHSYYTEAGLVNKLESLEIGRPSTYSTIIETLKDRGYVKKQNYEGIEVECNNYVLEDNKIKPNKIKKFFGAEKNKLFIQPIGKLALEFLVENFDSVFTYEYTKTMENKLDLISNKEIEDWSVICKECYNELKSLSTSMKNLEKKSYPICDNYEFIFEKYGPVIKHLQDDGEIEYLQGNKQINIDIDKLKNGEYTLEDLLDPGDICIGEYEDHKMYIKHGRYGHYIEWGENKESIKGITKPIHDITMTDIIEFLKTKKNANNILRELTDNANIRKGKYGAYVFYKTASMKKPTFLNIKKCPHGFLNCDKEILIEWINKEYKINI
jgi:DNA topoisomerase-1